MLSVLSCLRYDGSVGSAPAYQSVKRGFESLLRLIFLTRWKTSRCLAGVSYSSYFFTTFPIERPHLFSAEKDTVKLETLNFNFLEFLLFCPCDSMHGIILFHACKRMESKNVMISCMKSHGIQPIIWFHPWSCMEAS